MWLKYLLLVLLSLCLRPSSSKPQGFPIEFPEEHEVTEENGGPIANKGIAEVLTAQQEDVIVGEDVVKTSEDSNAVDEAKPDDVSDSSENDESTVSETPDVTDNETEVEKVDDQVTEEETAETAKETEDTESISNENEEETNTDTDSSEIDETSNVDENEVTDRGKQHLQLSNHMTQKILP